MGYRDVIGNFDARMLEEIEGIASGAGRGAPEILALNVRTEILPLDRPNSAFGPTNGCWLIARAE